MITDLTVIYDDEQVPSGYYKIPADLNKGARGRYVYLCYSTAPGTPITNIQVFAANEPDFPIQIGYTRIPKDLNKGARGKYIYVCYTKDTVLFPPISEVRVIQDPNPAVYPPTAEWVRINQDCSQGARGDYSYIIYKRANMMH